HGMDATEIAELYCAGALSAAEVDAMNARINAGDVELARAVADVLPTLEGLLYAEPLSVDPSLRVRVLEAADPEGASKLSGNATEVAADWQGVSEVESSSMAVGAGVVVLRGTTGRWRSAGLRGVRYRQLWADRRANRRTILLRLEPGAE